MIGIFHMECHSDIFTNLNVILYVSIETTLYHLLLVEILVM
jgi:hypothetical protein